MNLKKCWSLGRARTGDAPLRSTTGWSLNCTFFTGHRKLSQKKHRGAPDRGLKVVRTFTNSWGGGGGCSWNLMLSSNLLKSKIPICGGVGGFAEFDAEFKFAKIQNSHLSGSGGDWGGGGFVEFDAEFKFAKIQNSHLWGG